MTLVWSFIKIYKVSKGERISTMTKESTLCSGDLIGILDPAEPTDNYCIVLYCVFLYFTSSIVHDFQIDTLFLILYGVTKLEVKVEIRKPFWSATKTRLPIRTSICLVIKAQVQRICFSSSSHICPKGILLIDLVLN